MIRISQKSTFVFMVLLFLSVKGYTQGEIPVDMFTGTPAVQVPIWSLTDHDLSASVSLNYRSTGLKVGQAAGIVGIGWNLHAGSSISREVRGLPDDFMGVGSDLRRGWLQVNSSGSGVAADVGAFGNSADLSSGASCADEDSDNNKISSFNYNIDTEPDVYSYTAGNSSGNFVFDNTNSTPVIRLMPYADIKIEPTFGANLRIVSFKITTNDGVVYTFDQAVDRSRWTTRLDLLFNPVDPVQFQQRDFSLYDKTRYNKNVDFSAEWKLGKIESPSGAAITYNYSSEQFVSEDTLRVGIRYSPFSAIIIKNIYLNRVEGSQKVLSSVQGSAGQRLSLAYSGGKCTALIIEDFRRSTPEVKRFQLSYFSGGFLKSVQEISGCDIIPSQKFSYVGLDPAQGISDYPNAYSFKKDFWGYYNGRPNHSLFPKIYVYPALAPAERYRICPIPAYAGQTFILPGDDRTPDNYSMQLGVLEKIEYPTGGSATIKYEPNSYYDEVSLQTNVGGGLRVASIAYFDGLNKSTVITKNYNYDETPGKSSGRLLTRPSFAIPTLEYRDPMDPAMSARKTYATLSSGSQQDMWEYLTVRSREDLSSDETTQGSSIGYKNVKVSRSGSGYVMFEFSLPGAFGESTNGDWSATQNKFARANVTCASMGIVSAGGINVFPFAANPDYGYERGLLLKKTEFNETGHKVRETLNTYQSLIVPGSTPYKVWGLKYDRYSHSSDVFFYGKYFHLTSIQKVQASEVTTVYDPADAARSIASRMDYYYESGNHKLLNRVKATTAEGLVYTTTYKYPLDFGAVPVNSDKALEMIGKLQTSFRNSVPIEQVSSVNRGSGDKTIGASLTKFNDFGMLKILPQYLLSLRVPGSGITDFQSSGSSLQSGTYTLTNDARYDVVQTFAKYDQFQMPISTIGIDNVPAGIHLGSSKTLPIATAKNATPSQFVYSDFEALDNSGFEFDQSGVGFGTGRTGANAVHPVAILTKTVDKAAALNYVLSFWFKKQTAAVDFRVLIRSTNLATTYYDNTFTVNPNGSNFEYFRKVIPVSNVPASFAVQLQGQFAGGTTVTSSPGLLPLIDDVLFYPDNADVTTYSYNIPYGVEAVTDARGLTSFNRYDKLGRVTYELDQDYNIRKRNTYTYSGLAAPVLTSNFVLPAGSVYTAISYSFSGSGSDCIPGVTYQWSFNGVLVNGKDVSYTFPAAGQYEITLTANQSGSSPMVSTQNLTVVVDPCKVLVANFNPPSDPVYDITSYNFNANGNDCIAGVNYQWSFNGVLVNGKNVSYTFPAPGIYHVILTVTHAVYAQATSDQVVNVVFKPWAVPICAKGTSVYNLCTGDVIDTYSCSGITATPQGNGTIFKITSFTPPPGESVVSYQWKRRNQPSQAWTGVSSNDTYSISSFIGLQGSIDISIEITTNTGRICTSFTGISITTCN